ncbi:MAG TPA: hypothetical protein VN673_07560, partial [Clostridia bacterium]|nr:hypothetical protein [Clostridia bacterium]
GQVVKVEQLIAQRREVPVVPLTLRPVAGPQFLFSDKPEYYRSNGISLREEVRPGAVRLYVYHVPEPAGVGKTISAVVENLSTTNSLRLVMTKQSTPAPGLDYHGIAKSALVDFLSPAKTNAARRVPPGGRVVLDSKLDGQVATTNQLVHGLYEFEVDQPARVTVFQREVEQESLKVVDGLPLLPGVKPGVNEASGAGRGRFENCNLEGAAPGYVVDTAQGAMQVVVADGRRDPWIRGRDSIDALEARNVGNYGVLYRIKLERCSSDGRGLALLMGRVEANNRYCGGLGAAVQVSPGMEPGGVVALPSERAAFYGPGEAVMVQKFEPLKPGQTETIEVVYSPPGAACLPTPLYLVPFDM